MYQVEGRIYEDHGEYNCYLALWSESDAGNTRVRLWNLYERHLTGSDAAGTEHALILDVLMSALSRTAENTDRPLF